MVGPADPTCTHPLLLLLLLLLFFLLTGMEGRRGRKSFSFWLLCHREGGRCARWTCHRPSPTNPQHTGTGRVAALYRDTFCAGAGMVFADAWSRAACRSLRWQRAGLPGPHIIRIYTVRNASCHVWVYAAHQNVYAPCVGREGGEGGREGRSFTHLFLECLESLAHRTHTQKNTFFIFFLLHPPPST